MQVDWLLCASRLHVQILLLSQDLHFVSASSFPEDQDNPLNLLPHRRRSTYGRRQRTAFSDDEYVSDFSLDPDLAIVRGGVVSRMSRNQLQTSAEHLQRTQDELFQL